MCVQDAAYFVGRFLGRILLGEDDEVAELLEENQGFGGALVLGDPELSDADDCVLQADYDCNGDLRF